MNPCATDAFLHERVAIVTGGGRGMGRAMTLALAAAGMHVIATAARERAEVEAVAEEAQRQCGHARVLPLCADVTHEDDCERVLATALQRLGLLTRVVPPLAGLSAMATWPVRPDVA